MGDDDCEAACDLAGSAADTRLQRTVCAPRQAVQRARPAEFNRRPQRRGTLRRDLPGQRRNDARDTRVIWIIVSEFAIPPFSQASVGRHEAPTVDAREVATGHASSRQAQSIASTPRSSNCPRQSWYFICDGQMLKMYINTFYPCKLFSGHVLEEEADS